MLAPNGDYVAADLDDYPTDSNGSISSLLLEVTGFSSYNAGRLTGPDGNEMDTERFLASLKVITKKLLTAVMISLHLLLMNQFLSVL